MKNKRGNVWLAVSGLVQSSDGKWLVVKKKYGGLKGMWSLPAGFVEAGETADEAVIREIKEETGINCVIKGLIGLRTGVIHEEISDNMLMFMLEPIGNGQIKHQEEELFEARYIAVDELLTDKDASILLHQLMVQNSTSLKPCTNGLNPGDQFGYTKYKIFL
ncbi:NUDIX hydrolase [Neobacillus sp. PS3-40]|uniref:NUDIX hydrolase n=1 Tax=Neobacillus sp. PS3-40 TaxID=3070679 RepID=UPI0027DEB9B2|nr:NUDIX hydrolase [Neobacillus sp. PS3-40]WML45881.1 NUDIX hydrolase [Neobacillus sp. PS3-40]